MSKEEMIQALIDYHNEAAIEAESNRYLGAAHWYKHVRDWLQSDGLHVLSKWEEKRLIEKEKAKEKERVEGE